MSRAKTFGSGWHFQPIRHSNARRYGRAGGQYRGERKLQYLLKQHELGNLKEHQYEELADLTKEKIDFEKTKEKELLQEAIKKRRIITQLEDVREKEYIKFIQEYSKEKKIPKWMEDTLIRNKKYIFEKYQNSNNWKEPTKPAIAENLKDAETIASAINYFVGGSEIKKLTNGKYLVTSKGYYYYIGA